MTMFDEYRNAVSGERNPVAMVTQAIRFYLATYAFLLVTLFLSIQFVRGWFDSEN